jgi:hypothetical protein
MDTQTVLGTTAQDLCPGIGGWTVFQCWLGQCVPLLAPVWPQVTSKPLMDPLFLLSASSSIQHFNTHPSPSPAQRSPGLMSHIGANPPGLHIEVPSQGLISPHLWEMRDCAYELGHEFQPFLCRPPKLQAMPVYACTQCVVYHSLMGWMSLFYRWRNWGSISQSCLLKAGFELRSTPKYRASPVGRAIPWHQQSDFSSWEFEKYAKHEVQPLFLTLVVGLR